MKTLRDLFLGELADRYDAESRMAKVWPEMEQAAVEDDLKAAFEDHLKETEGHITKLEEIFGCFGEKVRGRTCETTVSLLNEGRAIAAEFKGSPALDAALIAAGQKVEHHEIASYGCLRDWALVLGNEKAADLIQEILEEEQRADRILTEIAHAQANDDAGENLVVDSPSQRGGSEGGAIPAGVGGQPENDEDARAAGLKSATETGPARK